MITPNIMFIGCGPHAKRVYIPTLKESANKYGTTIKVVIELKEKQEEVSEFTHRYFADAEIITVEQFGNECGQYLSGSIQKQLDEAVKKHDINAIVLATDPLHHIQYALWAQKQNLHILMDKPISTYDNIANSMEQAKQLLQDYNLLISNYNAEKAFIINAQRRFLPQFQIIQDKVNEIASKYGMPVTAMQSTHCDGQWRLPNEILTLKYHPLIGWGKVSHSGYHFIDMASKVVKDSYFAAGKKFDNVSVFSKFIRPSGLLRQQCQKDLFTIFGQQYKELDERSDEELLSLYKINNEAEIDACALVTIFSKDIAIANITLNMLHNGFSRRYWMMPNMKDLYKGNGRVRHEYHNIVQGCLQNIQIHSYQSSDHHDYNTEQDFMLGGNNHYDIYIFRNSGILGGEALEVITAKQVAESYSLDKSKVMNELARHEAVKQFLEVIIGKRKACDTNSNITDHGLSVQLMSMIYESAVSNKEIMQRIYENSERE